MFGLSSYELIGLGLVAATYIWQQATLHYKVDLLYRQAPEQKRQREQLIGLEFRVSALERNSEKARAS